MLCTSVSFAIAQKRFVLVSSRSIGHTEPASGAQVVGIIRVQTVTQRYGNYRGGRPVPRAMSSRRQLLHKRYHAQQPAGFPCSFHLYKSFSSNQTAGFKLSSSLRVVVECSRARESCHPCDPRSRSRAHDIGLR